jgi:hypothetical protein
VTHYGSRFLFLCHTHLPQPAMCAPIGEYSSMNNFNHFVPNALGQFAKIVQKNSCFTLEIVAYLLIPRIIR